MKQILVLLVIALGLSACNQGLKGDNGAAGSPGSPGVPGDQGPVGPSPTPTPVSSAESKVAEVLKEENDYRLGLGQAVLSSGLGCTLYTFTSGDRIQASIAGHNTFAGLTQVATFLLKSAINQPDSPSTDGMNVLPSPLRLVYTNLYLIRCQGQIVVTETNYYSFDLSSDDASLLYVDGVKLIDNDNNHGITTVSGTKYLRKGVHAFRVDYAQAGAGNQAFVLKSGGELVDPLYFAH